jgi:molecular chaperone DnaK
MAHQVEKRLQELGEQAPINEKARAEEMILQVRDLVKAQSSDITRLRQLMNDLQQILYGLAAVEARKTGTGGPDDVIDADFKKAG